MATSWKGGTSPLHTVSSASAPHIRIGGKADQGRPAIGSPARRHAMPRASSMTRRVSSHSSSSASSAGVNQRASAASPPARGHRKSSRRGNPPACSGIAGRLRRRGSSNRPRPTSAPIVASTPVSCTSSRSAQPRTVSPSFWRRRAGSSARARRLAALDQQHVVAPETDDADANQRRFRIVAFHVGPCPVCTAQSGMADASPQSPRPPMAGIYRPRPACPIAGVFLC